jgi:hypothetical protein
VKQHYPDVLAHLKKNYMMPEMYYQKYYCALCVHVLPYESLYTYIERFAKDGYKSIFRFAMNLVDQLSGELLKYYYR